jgi:hypothetical protein
MNDFLCVIDWLYTVNGHFGVDHIIIGDKIYWLDVDTDRLALFKLYKNYIKEN